LIRRTGDMYVLDGRGSSSYAAHMSPRGRAGERRLADMAAYPTQEELALEEERDEYSQTFVVSESIFYIVRFVYGTSGRLIEWAVVQMCGTPGKARRIAVYDTCHGKGVHVHHYNRNEIEFDQTALRPADSVADLEDGLDYATIRVAEAYEENERRSNRGY
jgi:hypothetical protein